MCVTKTARHSRARARHQRASRASSPISVPPGHARVAAAAALARRSITRTRCGVGDGGGDSGRLHRASRASRALRVTRADAHVITMRRARHCRFLTPPCTTGTRALRWRRRLLDRAHTVRRWHWRWRWRSVTPRATHAARHTRACARHQSASHKERARLNRRTKQLEFDLDIARRDAAAARADEAAARADGAADRAKIASLRILKVALPIARTHTHTSARRGAALTPVHFGAPSLSPRARAAALARLLALAHARLRRAR